MKTKYLRYTQACILAGDYQHLCGQPLDGAHLIDLVIVVPYSRILQWRYISACRSGTADADLLQNPKDHFDVVLVSLNGDSASGFRVKDLRTYLAERAINFDPKLYSCRGIQKR